MIALFDELKVHPPFTLLDPPSFTLIETTAQIAYYPKGTVLIHKNEIPENFFIIIKGALDVLDENEEPIDVYHMHDTFGGVELLEKQPSKYRYVVSEELICFEVSGKHFCTLCENNTSFKNYFFSTIIQRMELLKEKQEYASLSDLMVSRIDESILHHASLVSAQTKIVDALKQMDKEGATCMLVENSEGYGIVTDADLRYYILHKEEENLEFILQIQTYPIFTIKQGELLFNILLLMTEHSIKHLPVLDSLGNPQGVLELIDVVSFFSNQSHLITVQMERAQSIQSIVDAAKRLDVMVGALHAKGVKSRYIAKLVSEINKKMYVKLFEMIIPQSWQEKCALVLLGSEGRASQILRTDQDNALVFENGFIPQDVASVTQRFIEVLDEIGFPRCEGNIMMINPKWCKSVDGYKEDIYRWLDEPSYENFMDMAIFFDSAAIAGNKALHRELIDYLFAMVEQNKQIL
ncbi:MAG: hypothetical protein RLZZ428_733, partial [Pseudomonadota bacterium]